MDRLLGNRSCSSPGCFIRSGITAFTVNVLLALYEELPGCFPKRLCSSVSLPQRGRVPGLPALGIVPVFLFVFLCFSGILTVASSCGFNLHFPKD